MSACATRGASVPRGRSITATTIRVRLRAKIGTANMFDNTKRVRKMARSTRLETKPTIGT